MKRGSAMRQRVTKLGLTACLFVSGSVFAAGTTVTDFVPVDDATLQNPAADDWLMWRRTLNSWGYSPLEQVDRDNVRQLTLAWSRGLAEPQGAGVDEGTPLAYGGVLYVPSRGDVIQALDATTGDLIWNYRRSLPDDIEEYLFASATNRNIAIWQDLIISTSADEYLFALDARSGEMVWETRINDYHTHPALQTSGPIIANGKVISTRGCEPKGGPDACVITAHDARTGKELWRTSTIEPFQGEDDTWGGMPWEDRWHVGAWLVPSFDPELNRIFVGTSVTSPAPKFMMTGNENEYLYHNSTLALDAETGEIAWHFQHLVDHWDLDHTFERLLLDTVVAPDPDAVRWINPDLEPGEKRRVVTGIPGKTGIVYTLDRVTGEFLWATESVHQNVVADIDTRSGRATVNPEKLFTGPGQTLMVCPSTGGGKNWQAGAYSPQTNTMYFPLQNTCMQATSIGEKPDLGSLYSMRLRTIMAPDVTDLGTVQAFSAATGERVWRHDQRAAMMSLVATGGGLVFGGDTRGRFHAFDDTTGATLWEVPLGAMITGYPITYAVDGRQYIAVSTGEAVVTGSYMTLTPEIQPSKTRSLYVFALPAPAGSGGE
ncbi:pyrroloquinoline quinone-dependent dehydrogenase [Elongatibacter sediminis]|uniref:PQQ-binding-like beta-propeller repeat protein n=1 Tax=Elongatibacter sediminis TaxID=3119006 RepID=A0AAW9RK17_9GAMM